jgi:hypothetical protein
METVPVPITILEAMHLAIHHERIQNTQRSVKSSGPIISEIGQNQGGFQQPQGPQPYQDSNFNQQEEIRLDAQIDELQRRKQQFSRFNNNSRNYGNNGNGNGNGGNGNGNGSGQSGPRQPFTNGSGCNGGQNGRTQNPAKGKKCHYCKKLNHFQKECYKRKKEGGALVKINEHDLASQDNNGISGIFSSASGPSAYNHLN